MKRLLADLFSRRASNNPLFVALLAASVTLAACGGGGGDDNGSNQPVSNVAPDKPTAASGTPASTPSAASAPAAASAPSPASTPASNGAPSSVNTPSAASAPAAASAPSAASSPSASTPASETGTSGSGNAGSANSTDTPSTPTVASNTAPIVIDGTLSNVNQLVNMPYVSVTFCVPGKQGASQCASVDHMLLDTGSVGVRVISAALGAALGAKLPAQTGASNDPTGTAAIAQCALFASGYTWGSTRRADVTIGEKTASGIPIQLIGDSGFTWTPSDCSSRGGPGMNDVAHLGANGIVGIGNLARDYPGAANAPLAANYYYCPTPWSCTAASVPLNKQTANPVAAFATDNNGTIIRLPAVPPTGLASVTGELVFGIGTRENNALPATPTLVVVTDDRGGFTTNYRGRTVSSFVDSGSNGLFFQDSTLPLMTGNSWFAPATTQSLSAIMISKMGNAQSSVPFSIADASSLFALGYAAYGNLGGASSSYFIWGLPFFYGRSVYTALSGVQAATQKGPYVAF